MVVSSLIVAEFRANVPLPLCIRSFLMLCIVHGNMQCMGFVPDGVSYGALDIEIGT